MLEASEENRLRLDKWLWAARFYKTRTIAAEAVNGGKVQVNGERVKSSRRVQPGDRLDIRRGHYAYSVTITSIAAQRRSAQEAQEMYVESAESLEARSIMQLRLKAEPLHTGKADHRPNKRERRQLLKMKKVSGTFA